MTEMSQDPRDSLCSVNTRQTHRWSRSFKDQIARGRFVLILRCRYCARCACIDLERIVLPSGRVIVKERAFETTRGQAPEEVTAGLRGEIVGTDEVKSVEDQKLLMSTLGSLTPKEQEAATKQRIGHDKSKAKL